MITRRELDAKINEHYALLLEIDNLKTCLDEAITHTNRLEYQLKYVEVANAFTDILDIKKYKYIFDWDTNCLYLKFDEIADIKYEEFNFYGICDLQTEYEKELFPGKDILPDAQQVFVTYLLFKYGNLTSVKTLNDNIDSFLTNILISKRAQTSITFSINMSLVFDIIPGDLLSSVLNSYIKDGINTSTFDFLFVRYLVLYYSQLKFTELLTENGYDWSLSSDSNHLSYNFIVKNDKSGRYKYTYDVLTDY